MSSGRNLLTFRRKLPPLSSGYSTPLLHTTLLMVHVKYRYISVKFHYTTSQKSTFARIEVLIIRRNTVSRSWEWKMTVSIMTKLRTMTVEKLSDSQQEQHIFRFSEVFISVLQQNWTLPSGYRKLFMWDLGGQGVKLTNPFFSTSFKIPFTVSRVCTSTTWIGILLFTRNLRELHHYRAQFALWTPLLYLQLAKA
jgi:hypothetical protein